MGGGCSWHNTVVAKIPEVIPTGHVVSAEGIPGNGTDPWHFSAEGYRIFGRRYAEKVLDVMNHPEAYTKTFAIDERLTGGTSALVDKTFAIVNEAEGKALYGSIGRNLDYGDYKQAFDISNEGFLFKMGRITGGRALRLITPDNEVYQIDGETGYLNSQDVNGDCCFIQGLNGQRGYEIPDGAVWKPEYVEGKGWTLMNVGTGKYLKDATTAKYDEPTYFTFCTLADVTTGIKEIPNTTYTNKQLGEYVYTLQGVKVGKKSDWNRLPQGLYIVGGKKLMKQ